MWFVFMGGLMMVMGVFFSVKWKNDVIIFVCVSVMNVCIILIVGFVMFFFIMLFSFELSYSLILWDVIFSE